MTSLSTRTTSTTCAPALVRFVTDGLLATVDSYLVGDLPLHRLARELHARIDTLVELHPPTRTLTRLRWLQRDVEHLHAVLSRADRSELTAHEQAHLAGTVGTLRAMLAALLSPNPLDPAGAARPAAGVGAAAGVPGSAGVGAAAGERAADRSAAARHAAATSPRPPGRRAATGLLSDDPATGLAVA